jgi:hypothetical protein
MVKLDHDSGSRQRAADTVYPGDFLPDTESSQHGSSIGDATAL